MTIKYFFSLAVFSTIFLDSYEEATAKPAYINFDFQ